MPDFRQPIVSLLGHVDHGKTTLLDRIAGIGRTEREAGGITQQIGAIEVPKSKVLERGAGLLDAGRLEVPGLLFIDTPGHRSFETLRRRGGALADLAILAIDVREGVMPQTRESIGILRKEKTPFAVALTKIDLLAGWRKPPGPVALAAHLKRCGEEYAKLLDQKLYAVSEELDRVGFSADRYDRVSDFTRNIGIVPVSAKSDIGVSELIALLVGLAQRFLKEELELVTGGCEATILERSELRGIGPVVSAIVYEGRLSVGDEVLAMGASEPFQSRVRGLYRPEPPKPGRGGKHPTIASLDHADAAAVVFLSAPGIEAAMPGGLLKTYRDDDERARAEAELVRESQPVTEWAESGVALAADTLGGLEALAYECREAKIPVHEAAVGPVGRPTFLRMALVKDPVHRAILAFNSPILPEAQPEGVDPAVRLIQGDVMYRIVEEYVRWRDERAAAIRMEHRLTLLHPAKLEILKGNVFRRSRPAIVGIRVLAGTVRPGVRLMRLDGSAVGLLKALQKEGESQSEAEERAELAASIDGAVIGRNVEEGETLLVDLPESAVRALRGIPLTGPERAVLEEITRIRRAEAPFWGQ